MFFLPNLSFPFQPVSSFLRVRPPQFPLLLPEGNCLFSPVYHEMTPLPSLPSLGVLSTISSSSFHCCLFLLSVLHSVSALLMGSSMASCSLHFTVARFHTWQVATLFWVLSENLRCFLARPVNVSGIRTSLAAWENVMTTNLGCLRQHSQACQTIT